MSSMSPIRLRVALVDNAGTAYAFNHNALGDYRIGYLVNPNPNTVKECILLTNLKPYSDSVNPTLIPFHLRRDDGDEC